MLGISAPIMAPTPMDNAGMKILMPILTKFPLLSRLPGTDDLPFPTRRRIAGMAMSVIRAPSTVAGIHRPKAMTTPRRLQNMQVPYRVGFDLSRRLRTPV